MSCNREVGKRLWQVIAGIAVVLVAAAFSFAPSQPAGKPASLEERAVVFFEAANHIVKADAHYAFAYQATLTLPSGETAGTLRAMLREQAGDEAGTDILVKAIGDAAKSPTVHVYLRFHGEQPAVLLARAIQMKGYLQKQGWPDEIWNIRADGDSLEQAQCEGSLPQEAAILLRSADTVDRYQDQRNCITRYHVSELGANTAIGEGAGANLQVAYHLSTETGTWSAAVASPMLTGEL